MKKSSPERAFKGMRKLLKPMVEKRRRERINSNLESLRVLLLEKRPNEKLKNPKVEKADILETAVQFIRAQNQSLEPLPDEWQNYQAGYHDCLQRAAFLLNAKKDLAPERKAFLGGYFSSCLNQLPASSMVHPHGVSPQGAAIHGHLSETATVLSGASSGRHLDLIPPIGTLPSEPRRFTELQAQSQPSHDQQQSLQEGGMHTNRTAASHTNNDFPALISAVWRPWP
ncbi:transcription factor HES-7.1-like [Lissotriton helveticus]